MQIIKNNNRILVARQDDYIIKKYKNLSQKSNTYLRMKLEKMSDLKNINELVLPCYYELRNGMVEEIYIKYIDFPNLCYDVTKNFISFKTITDCFENLEKAIIKLHDKDVILADFSTEGNLKYNPVTKGIYILDYMDMQIDNTPAFSYSYYLKDFLSINAPKYFKHNRFTKNADIYLLANLWLRLCTSQRLCNLTDSPFDTLEKVGILKGNIAKKILDNPSKENMKIGNLYFEKFSYSFKGHNSLTIIDNMSVKTKLINLIKTSIIIFVLLEIVIILISLRITNWIIKPVIESFNKQKQFITDASHELKTPLAVIMANAEALEREPDEEKWLYNIKTESERMNELITELLNLAKLENEAKSEIYDVEDLSKITLTGDSYVTSLEDTDST